MSLSDTPVGYAPPIGPSAKVKISYNQREDSQPAIFSFFNISPKWTLNWLTYIADDPTNPGAAVSRYIAGGGSYSYTGYQSSTGRFATQSSDGTILVLASQSPITYRRLMGDGSVEVFAQSNGSSSFPRRVFLSQVIDPQGNAVTLNYDGQLRLTSLTDATGRQTTFTYGLASRPLLITQITDPFGRSAALTYDSNGRLNSITDVIGLTSSFTYDANSLVNSLTTPYGTTNFSYTAPGTSAPPRFVQITDPLGYSEREEWLEPSSTPASDPAPTVPTGMPVTLTNQFLDYRSSFHWDKNAYLVAGCTPTGGCDYSKARARHFLHTAGATNQKSAVMESVKHPLENRIWYNYPGQTSSIFTGTSNLPIAIGRVLDDGTTQLRRTSYDTDGFYKITKTVDPVGRTTSYAYSNQIDLAAISQTTEYGVQKTTAQYAFNTQHRPILYTDAAGQTTSYEYNAAGQVTLTTDPLGRTTTYHYNASSDLTEIINANSVTVATFTYDAYDRVRTYTDSEGWAVTYDYDAADRVTKVTYPDGTTDSYTYDKLDLASYLDRQGHLWIYTHDANRRLTTVTNPSGEQTLFAYNRQGLITSLTDASSNTTSWAYDVQGRLIEKTYADASTVTYTYENTTSRLKSTLDALGQTKQYSYTQDDRLAGKVYLNAVNPTSSVSFAYDRFFPRLTSMTDGTGTTQYSYFAVGALGALQLQQEQGPLANSAITYTYDELRRPSTRTITGSGTESYAYDTIGRLANHTSDLGAFTLSYLGETLQITQRQLTSSTVATTWGYAANASDRRLASINNTGMVSGHFSNYGYSSSPANLISGITETSDAATVYPAASVQTASYNNLNQLTNLSGQTLTYDANGNLLSDGLRSYAWDAEDRLVDITYPGAPGKETTFAYDGLGRRVSISSTPPGGGTAVTTWYLWCGQHICQARNSSNATIRSYHAEGEFVPGSPGQPYYYGIDQVGSVRRAFASSTIAPAYSFDPYGNALQSTALLTDFSYAGMFYNADSGLYLTLHRAYDPVAGRWLSRDPLGEKSDLAANLYAYVRGNPVSNIDPYGNVILPKSVRDLAVALRMLMNLFGPDNPDNPGGPPQNPPPTASNPGPVRPPEPPGSSSGPKPPGPGPDPDEPCDPNDPNNNPPPPVSGAASPEPPEPAPSGVPKPPDPSMLAPMILSPLVAFWLLAM